MSKVSGLAANGDGPVERLEFLVLAGLFN